jgi:hypothetical protein
MYSVVLLTAMTAGGEATAAGSHGWWYAPIPYVDVAWPVPINYAPSPAKFAPGGVIGPSLAVALRWIVPAGDALTEGERAQFLEYFNALSPDEQLEVLPVWHGTDYAGQRRLLARIAALKPKKEKDE